MRRRWVVVAAVTCLAPVTMAKASLLFDNISAHEAGTTFVNVTDTGSTPNTFMGDGYVLASGATDITGLDLFPVNVTGTNYTGLQIGISIWGTVNTGTVSASSPAFSNLLHTYSLDYSYAYTSGYIYPFQGATPGASPGIAFDSPLQLNGATTIGITVDYEGSINGSPYNTANGLTSLISYGVPPTVGSQVFNGYYRNANSETNGNFTSTLRSLGDPDQSLALRIFGDVASGENQWIASTGGEWTVASNWSAPSVPAASTDAIFNLGSSNYTVALPTSEVCKDLYVQSDNVTFDMSSSGSSLAVSGALTVGQPATAGAGINGVLNLTRSVGGSSANVSAASLAVGGNGGTGQLTIGSAVRLNITGTASVATGSSLTIASGGKLNASNLSISGSTNAWTGLVDIGTSTLDLPSGNLATATNQVKQGYNAVGGGNWNGSGGITSSAAANDSTHLTAVGVIMNNDGSGTPLYGTGGALGAFGSNSPGLNDVLIRYTYYGDANLDGTVDGSDYSLIDNGYLNHLTGWYNGDFNYDGVVDGSDYTLIDNAFNTQSAGLIADAVIAPAGNFVQPTGGTASAMLSGNLSAVKFEGSAASDIAAVPTAAIAPGTAAIPEPATFTLLALASVCTLRRKSRRGLR